MKKLFLGVFIVLFFVVAVSNAHAQLGFYLGVQGGVSLQKASFGDIKFNTDTTFLYGLRAGIKVFMLVAELNYYQTAYRLNPQDVSFEMWEGRKVGYSYIGANLKLLMPVLFLRPYLTAGYGYYTANIHEIDKQKNGGYNVGLGMELMLGKKFSLLAEGRYHHVTFDFADGEFKPGNYTLSGGFNYYF